MSKGDAVPTRGRELQVEVANTTSPTTVVLKGEIDLSTSPRVREVLMDIARSGEVRVVIDMSQVTFMDSTGLSALVGPLKRFRQNGGHITLRSPTSSVRKILEITGLTRVFTIE